MSHGPLVVLTRKRGASGWTVRVDPSSVRVGDTTFSVKGELIEQKSDGSREPSEVSPGHEYFARDGGTKLDVVCFRAEEQPRTQPTPKVMKAIEAVRSSDTEDARRVLSDVLEEDGAVAEAEYVRLELKLQTMRDVQSEPFIEGARQLKALSGVVGPTFRYLVGRDAEGCTGVRWAFRCPAVWEQMQETIKSTERVCTSCRQVVVQATSEDEANRLAREGVCASVRIEDEMWEGEVAAPYEPEEEPEQPRWVGSVAMRPPPVPKEVRPAADLPKPEKPWWKKIFGG